MAKIPRIKDGKYYRGLTKNGKEIWISKEERQKAIDQSRAYWKTYKRPPRTEEQKLKEKNKKRQPYDPVKAKESRIRRGQDPDYKRQPKQTLEEKRKKKNEYVKMKKKTDPLFKIRITTRDRVRDAIRKIKTEKSAKTIEFVGCSWKKLKLHIESQFSKGMTWENHGRSGWHIDHVIPLSCGTEIKGLTKLCHYSNLRPIWAKENLGKRNNLILQ